MSTVLAAISLSASLASSAVGWHQAAAIPNASLLQRNSAIIAATEGVDGRAYIETTCTHFRCDPTPTEIYNGTTNSWSPAAATTTETQPCCYYIPWAAATGVQGKVYAIGGGEQDETGFYPVADVVAYGSKTNTWATEASMPTPRGWLAASVGADGLVYALGGATAPFDSPDCCFNLASTNVVEAYNPNTNTWADEPPMQQPRDSFAAVLGSDNRLYAIAGEDQDFPYEGGETTPLSSVEAYSFSTHVWTYVAAFPVAGNMTGAISGSDGRIYAVGGGIVAAYSLTKNTWTKLATPPVGTASGGVVVATGVQAVNGTTSLLLIDDICNATKSGSTCSFKTYIYPT